MSDTATPAVAQPTQRDAELWLGGALLTFGTLAWVLLSAAHGDLPGTGQEAVQHVAGQLWRPVHILTIVAFLACTGGFALLVRTIVAPSCWAPAVTSAPSRRPGLGGRA